jgi:hypothetical protein
VRPHDRVREAGNCDADENATQDRLSFAIPALIDTPETNHPKILQRSAHNDEGDYQQPSDWRNVCHTPLSGANKAIFLTTDVVSGVMMSC